MSKPSINRWLARLGGLKEILLLYALCHEFIQQLIEGDDLYTKVSKNKRAFASEGWTIFRGMRSLEFNTFEPDTLDLD